MIRDGVHVRGLCFFGGGVISETMLGLRLIPTISMPVRSDGKDGTGDKNKKKEQGNGRHMSECREL